MIGGLALGARARGVKFGAAPASNGEHSTTVTLGFDWAWPNQGETQFLVFADSSWMVVGQALAIDDGVYSGVLTIAAIYPANGENPTIVECAWTTNGPPGGTIMLDGAEVSLVM